MPYNNLFPSIVNSLLVNCFKHVMLQRRLISYTSSLRVLTQHNFSLNTEWEDRYKHLDQYGLGMDYEFVVALHKKLQASGKISAVDLDAAACLVKDQEHIPEVLNFVYKFRHTTHAPEQLESTSYAIIRFLLKHEKFDLIFKILNDPINYGVFLNYHIGSVLINRFLNDENVPAAAKIATFIMQQEMFDCALLNYLSVYSLLKFIELPKDQRIFDDSVQPKPVEVEIAEEEQESATRVFRVPFLKTPYNDGQFDLTDENEVCGKSLEWFSYYLNDSVLKEDIHLLGLLMQSKFENVQNLLKAGKFDEKTLQICHARINEFLEQIPEENKQEDPNYHNLVKINELLNGNQLTDTDTPFSAKFWESFKPRLPTEEQTLIGSTKESFDEWNKIRANRIEIQAERLNLQLRLDEIKKRRNDLNMEHEILYFFDNRTELEDLAAHKEKLWSDAKILKKKGIEAKKIE